MADGNFPFEYSQLMVTVHTKDLNYTRKLETEDDYKKLFYAWH